MDPFEGMSQEDLGRWVMDAEPPEPFENQMIDRAEWEALPPLTEGMVRANPFTCVVTSFTETESCWNSVSCLIGVQELQKLYIKERKMSDVPYNFIVAGNGMVFEGRGWNQIPILPEKYSYLHTTAFHIGFFGMYGDGAGLNSDMLTSRDELIRLGMEQSYIAKQILYYQIIK